MRKDFVFFLLFVSLFSLTFSVFTPVARVHAAGQFPGLIIQNTYYEGTIGWGPVDADPTICYDTASGQLIFNAYQNLIAFHGEEYWQFDPVLATNVPTRQDITMTVTSTSAVLADPTGSTWTDGSTTFTITGWTDEGLDGFHSGDIVRMTDGTTWRTWTADVVSGVSPTMTIQLWRGAYVFNIRSFPTIDFYTSTGAVYDTYGLKDAVYCMQRLMVMDKLGCPPWMFDKPLFDLPDHTNWTNSTVIELAHLINDTIVGNYGANTLTIYEGCRFPDNAFKQILAGTWGSIYSSKYYKDMGNWNGDCFADPKGYGFPDWWVDFDRQGNGLSDSTLHAGTTDAGLDVPTPTSYCGSGPYYVQTVDSTNFKVIFQRNPGFWEGWPAPGNTPVAPATGYLDTYEVDYISDWTTRKADFLGGFIDSCAVPRGKMFEIVDQSKQPTTPGIKTIANILPTLSFDSIMFTFVVTPGSSYVGTGSFPDGIPLDFFSNTNVRKAFAYSFNYSTYGDQVYFGESDYRSNFLVAGLYPDYYNASAAPMYNESYDLAEANLKAAIFNNVAVWDSGFTFDLTFNTGNTERYTACQMIANFFNNLSTYDGRSASLPPFKMNIEEITWSQTINDVFSGNLPLFEMSWLADFADADDFLRPYMYSSGAFAYYQGYTAANGWGTTKDNLVNQAVLTPDEPNGSASPERQALYDQLAVIYYDDCPSFPVGNPRGRLFEWYWVKGWYYNAMYPARNIYTMWKQDTPWDDVSGPTTGVSDNVVNMRDIAYLIAHYWAHPPIPGTIDRKWVGVYGANGCVDLNGDRKCDISDITIVCTLQNFNAKGPGHP